MTLGWTALRARRHSTICPEGAGPRQALERCLWGTDWTRAYAVVNYEQVVKPFFKTDRLSARERSMLMGGTCVKAYGWSSKKG